MNAAYIKIGLGGCDMGSSYFLPRLVGIQQALEWCYTGRIFDAAEAKAKGYSFPAAWASPQWRKAFPKPRGLPITLLRGRDGKLLLAEKGQMFAEDVEAIAALV